MPSLPVIDLSRLDERPQLRTLRSVAREIGFFHVVGHGIDRSLDAALLGAARRFFALDDAAKQSIAMIRSPHFRGYTGAGGERTRGLPDWREQIDIGLDHEPVPRTRGGDAWTRLIGPNQWPASPPDFRPIVERWQHSIRTLLTHLLEAFALALGQYRDGFAGISGAGSHELLKLIRYPGRPTGEGLGQGVGAHKDGGLLSLILQDGEGGLEVETAGGRWLAAEPMAGAYVVNIGELLELASDGYFKATVHRVVSPAPGRDRVSAAFFLGARLDATVEALALPPDLAAESAGVARDPGNPLFRDIGRNTLKSRLRSHPDVAAAHHADLLADAEP